MVSSVWENVKSNQLLTKHPRNLSHHEKAKPKNDRNRRRSIPAPKLRENILHNHRQFPWPKVGFEYKNTSSIQNNKMWDQIKMPTLYLIDKRLKLLKEEKTLKTSREKGQVNYNGRYIRITLTSQWIL